MKIKTHLHEVSTGIAVIEVNLDAISETMKKITHRFDADGLSDEFKDIFECLELAKDGLKTVRSGVIKIKKNNG